MFGNCFYVGYLDPSVITYSFQTIIGVVIAVGAVFGIYFRRIRSFFIKKYNINFGRKKVIESDDIFIK